MVICNSSAAIAGMMAETAVCQDVSKWECGICYEILIDPIVGEEYAAAGTVFGSSTCVVFKLSFAGCRLLVAACHLHWLSHRHERISCVFQEHSHPLQTCCGGRTWFKHSVSGCRQLWARFLPWMPGQMEGASGPRPAMSCVQRSVL
jgi:hypothetical protein